MVRRSVGPGYYRNEVGPIFHGESLRSMVGYHMSPGLKWSASAARIEYLLKAGFGFFINDMYEIVETVF